MSPGASVPLGEALQRLYASGGYAELVRICRELLRREPHRGELWKILGVALSKLGEDGQAVQAKQEAARLLPQDAEAHANLANSLLRIGRLRDASRSLEQALHLNPQADAWWALLARSRWRIGEAAGAQAALAQALKHTSDAAALHNEWGSFLRDHGQMTQAAAHYRAALALRPQLGEAWNNLGNCLTAMGHAHGAAAAFGRALQALPQSSEVHSNRGNLMKEWGRLRESRADYQRAVELNPRFLGAHTNLLLVQNHLPDTTPEAALAHARRFGRWAMEQAGPPLRPRAARPAADSPPDSGPQQGATLRVGFISGDLRQHPVGYFARALFEHLPDEGFELFVYATLGREDALTRRLRQRAGAWCVLPADSQAAARRIASDRLNVLIDLAGHTAHNGLGVMAWRPAPVQASWLGYFASTGLPTMDWLIADDWSVPPADEGHYTERIARLPDTRLCYTPPDEAPEVAPSPRQRGGPLCFASFQPLAKYNTPVIDLWAQTLLAVPGSVLRLQQAFFADPRVCADMRAAFQARGVVPERLQLHGKASMHDYLRAYQQVDIVLDTFPFPGGTTTCEALWMGVPTLTLPGTRLISRQGSGLMRAAGLAEWVAADHTDWLEKAVYWSKHPDELAGLRSGLRERLRVSALMDGGRFARAFAAVLRGMQ